MEKRYKALRIVGVLYKILGVIAALITVLAVVSLCVTSILGGAAINRITREMGPELPLSGMMGGALGGLIGGLLIAFYSGGAAVTLYGMGEMIYLFLALEENTRKTASLLENQEEADLTSPSGQ